ncbi:MAG: hypothetical protein GY940_25580 [bacterium]|nr:hypothetical protein [bacterium]
MEWKPFSTGGAELKEFFIPAGKVEIKKDSIAISGYPFEPATVYPSAVIPAGGIDDISIVSVPPMLRLNNELIFVTAELKEPLNEFAGRHHIPIVKRSWNWDSILEPFLDTEYDKKHQRQTLDRLNRVGLTDSEVEKLREEVGVQMYKYNFDTMLWEWQMLGLDDVLRAMRPRYNKEEFHTFYWKAMDIELRKESST